MRVIRPAPDGKTAFLPIAVGTISSGDRVNPFTRHFYCGKCRKQMGWGDDYRLYELCPRCGAQIGDWYAAGMKEVAVRERRGACIRLPDQWPVTLDGFGCSSVSADDLRLSDGTVNDLELVGNG